MSVSESELRDRLDKAAEEHGVSIDHSNWDYHSNHDHLSYPFNDAEEHGIIPDGEPANGDGYNNPIYEVGGHEGGVLKVKSGELMFYKNL